MNHCFLYSKLRRFTSQMFPSLGNFCGFPFPTFVAFVSWALDIVALAAPVNFISWVGKLKHAYARETNISYSLILSCNNYYDIIVPLFNS